MGAETLGARNRHRWYGGLMKGPDLDRQRSEKKHSLVEFLALYNDGLPLEFPRATAALLAEYQNRYGGQFKDGLWSLGLHRKKFMDWLPGYLKSLEP